MRKIILALLLLSGCTWEEQFGNIQTKNTCAGFCHDAGMTFSFGGQGCTCNEATDCIFVGEPNVH